MENIDLTLRADFSQNSKRNRKFETDVQYDNALDYKDQRRAKTSILAEDDFIFNILGIKYLETAPYLKFFGDEQNTGWDELKLYENILKITGIITDTLKQEYDSGFGNENVCDCCGSFRSHILNSQYFGLCDNCEKSSKFRNEKFWDAKEEFQLEEQWID